MFQVVLRFAALCQALLGVWPLVELARREEDLEMARNLLGMIEQNAPRTLDFLVIAAVQEVATWWSMALLTWGLAVLLDRLDNSPAREHRSRQDRIEPTLP